MSKNRNYIFFQLKKFTEAATISFLLFYFVISGLKTDVYLGIYAAVLLILYFSAGTWRNVEILQELFITGIFITAGFGIAKIANGCAVYNVWKNWSWMRSMSVIFGAGELILFCRLKVKYQKHQKTIQEKEESELFYERKSDLERLSLYLSEVDAVGVNGGWGSGKTFLVDKYIEDNSDKYEVIKVEPLTCNMSAIDSYLFQELERVLLANRIYPRYSRRIQHAMADNSFGKQIYHFLESNEKDELTAFQGFCQDLDKLDHKILVVYEDIDRISKENRDQVARLFDLTQKMLPHNVKAIYEFDMKKMEKLDFSQDYLEKYIPYNVTLSEVSAETMITNGLEELGQVNAGLTYNDFRFLFEVRAVDYFLQVELGITGMLEFKVENLTPRKIKAFITEVNTIMFEEEFSNKENRKTVLAFFFMKHFFPEIYHQLPFEKSLLEEMVFAYQNKKTGETKNITILDLIARRRLMKKGGSTNGITTSEAIHMFFAEENQENWNKLTLLIELGYQIKFVQDELDAVRKRIGEIKHGLSMEMLRYEMLNLELEYVAEIEYNEKISRLILNLHRNGKSEYTDAEAVAVAFISEVLLTREDERRENWNKFLKEIYFDKLYKDNKVKRLNISGLDVFPSIFQDLWIYFSKHSTKYDRDIIFDSALKLYKQVGEQTKYLDLDKFFILNTFEFEKRKYFLETIKWFNELKITGNFNEDKSYHSFLKKYSLEAYKHGYLKEYGTDYLDALGDVEPQEKKGYIRCFLEECKKNIIMPEIIGLPPYMREEIKLVTAFFDKNLEILQLKKKGMIVPRNSTKLWTSEMFRKNLENISELEKRILKEDIKNPEIQKKLRKKLEEAYKCEEIDLKEYVELVKKLNKNNTKN